MSQSWQIRVLEFLEWHDTAEGCILIAALCCRNDLISRRYPRFGPGACINKDGLIGVLFWDKDKRYYGQLPLGKIAPHLATVDQLTEQFRRIADKNNLTDEERRDLFDALRTWLAYDERAESNIGA